MFSHDLAKKLLEGPDVPVCVHDGPAHIPIEVTDTSLYGGDWSYRDESDAPRRGEHITLS